MGRQLESDLLGVSKEKYGDRYADHLLEQYKTYVELTDKISERRQTANTFFLTINTALVTALGVVSPNNARSIELAWYAIVGSAGMVLCYSWWRLLKSYRDLNTGKFKVVHAIEQHLPVRPYDAEWASLGRGENPELYRPFTHIETGVPWVFFFLYVGLVLGATLVVPSAEG